jgi:hypothetical protein
MVVMSVPIQGYDTRRLFYSLSMCFLFYENCHKDSRFNSIKNGLYQDWRHHPVPSGNYTNQLQVSWGAKFKFLLNVNLNNFIIEHHWNQNPFACSSGSQDYFPGSLGQSENPGFGLQVHVCPGLKFHYGHHGTVDSTLFTAENHQWQYLLFEFSLSEAVL